MIGHQLQVVLDGVTFLTLADLWPQPCRAVIVGVNPAPRSVEAGHYYQGSNGRQAVARLRAAGLLPADRGGFADDEALTVGVGFTDVVKRPTPRARDLTAAELEAGRAELRRKLATHAVPLVVCVFKPAVTALLGHVEPAGFQSHTFGTARVFRMPGPYAPAGEVATAMAQLAAYLDES